jgi:phenylacetate-CoA ligase
VRRFQVIQDQPDHIELRVVAGDGWDGRDSNAVDRIVRASLGPHVRFDLTKVDDIPLTGAGKLRVVVNRCAAAPGGRPGEAAPAGPTELVESAGR